MSSTRDCPHCGREAGFHAYRCPGIVNTGIANSDLVNHPPHYNRHPSGVECITVVEHMGFNLGNAVKYIWRADEKGSAFEDLKKAAWYIAREIHRREIANRAKANAEVAK